MTPPGTGSTRRTRPLGPRVAALAALAALVTGLAVPAARTEALPAPDAGWLDTLNEYRQASGLAPVSSEPAWVDGQVKHLAYLRNTSTELRAAYPSAHTENPASPWYTPEGDAAARASNIGGGRNERDAIERWLKAPFHAIGMLRPQLQRAAFAADPTNQAMLDVIRGGGSAPNPRPLVRFPGAGSETTLRTFDGESPDPREGCAADWQNFRGLPVFALLPDAPVAGTSATLTLPDGTTLAQGNDLCVQTGDTYRSTDAVYGSTGSSILTGDRAVLVLPRAPLTRNGEYRVRITQPGRPDVTWTFRIVDGPTTTQYATVATGRAGAAAALVNLTMVDATRGGYVTADRCSQLPNGPQTRSNGNYGPGQAVANLAVVPVEADGRLCVYAQTPTNLIVDVQGEFAPGAPLRFDATTPRRLVDTRTRGPLVGAGGITRVVTGAPAGTQAVLVNLTMTDAVAAGYVTADRCTTLAAGPQTKSSGNHGPAAAASNLAVVPVDADGAFCVYNQTPLHLAADLQGTFSPTGALRLTTVPLRRLADTRTAGGLPAAGAIVRVATGLAGATAALVNLTMTDAASAGYVTADRCSALRPGPQDRSTANHGASQAVANLAVVPLDADGSFCLYTQTPTHLVVDLQGGWSPTGELGFRVIAPTRVYDSRTA